MNEIWGPISSKRERVKVGTKVLNRTAAQCSAHTYHQKLMFDILVEGSLAQVKYVYENHVNIFDKFFTLITTSCQPLDFIDRLGR